MNVLGADNRSLCEHYLSYMRYSHSPKVFGHMMPLSISDHQSIRFAGPMLLQLYLKWLRDAASECM